MPDFEFEFNQQDKDLIVNQSVGEFSNNDYMRLTIYPSEAINQVVTLQDNTKGIDGRAIFFSTLFEGPFSINISPFTNDNSFDTKIIGNDNANDFAFRVDDALVDGPHTGSIHGQSERTTTDHIQHYTLTIPCLINQRISVYTYNAESDIHANNNYFAGMMHVA